jgi:hypothetical protein
MVKRLLSALATVVMWEISHKPRASQVCKIFTAQSARNNANGVEIIQPGVGRCHRSTPGGIGDPFSFRFVLLNFRKGD